MFGLSVTDEETILTWIEQLGKGSGQNIEPINFGIVNSNPGRTFYLTKHKQLKDYNLDHIAHGLCLNNHDKYDGSLKPVI